MAKTTARVLRTDTPAASLAVWLAAHHPDLFLTTVRHARAAKASKRLQGLGDDPTFDPSAFLTVDPSTFDSTATDFDLSSFEPDLQTVEFDPDSVSLPDNLLSDSTASGAGFLSSIADSPTSAGGSVASALGGGLSSVFNALGTATKYLSTGQGQATLSSLVSLLNPTQAAVVNTQVARTATNQAVLPVSYGYNTTGQLVPVYAPTGQQLTPQGLASLTPSSFSVFFSKYGVYVAAAAVVVAALVARRMNA